MARKVAGDCDGKVDAAVHAQGASFRPQYFSAAAAAGNEGTDDESAAKASGANVPWFAFSSSSP